MGDTDHFIPFEEDDATALVSRREIISGRIKLDSRDDIGCRHEGGGSEQSRVIG